jgi:hypothetical protein
MHERSTPSRTFRLEGNSPGSVPRKWCNRSPKNIPLGPCTLDRANAIRATPPTVEPQMKKSVVMVLTLTSTRLVPYVYGKPLRATNRST